MITEIIIGGFLFHTFPVPKPVKQNSFQKNLIIKSGQFNFMVGDNSIGESILGLGYDFKMSENLNFKIGGYIQDTSKFEDLGVDYLFGDLVPIVGFEYSIPINKTIGISTIITLPVIYTGLSVRF